MHSETLSYFWEVIKWISPVVISVSGFFIGQIMNRVNKIEEKITQLEVDAFRIERVEKKQSEITSDMKKIREEINEVKINYIHKEDFFKEMNKLDNKIERILDLIIERGVRQ